MPIKILMPALSPTMEEGKLAKWTVKEGDSIESGDVIAEIETDKATMEVEAVDEGIVGRILVDEGTEAVPVNGVIALLLEEGEDKSALDDVDISPTKKVQVKTEEKTEPRKEPSEQQTPKPEPEPEQAKQKQSSQKNNDDRLFASPLARRIAREKGLDLSTLQGSGPRGRIVKQDVEKAHPMDGQDKATRGASQQPSNKSMPVGVDAKAVANSLGVGYETLPANNVRQIIANRLQESKQTIPHFYLTVDCELDALLEMRKTINADAQGYKISVNDFIIRASAKALRDVPAANASWAGDSIIQYNDVDISIAVASENGLITPIIKKADEKTLTNISNEMKDLAERAREGKLKPQEFQGGGFTISNLGMYGIKEFSAIINPPQSCILAVGKGEQRPIVKDGELAIATIMTVTLSVDHRSVDGAIGAEFLASFKQYIENPAKILV